MKSLYLYALLFVFASSQAQQKRVPYAIPERNAQISKAYAKPTARPYTGNASRSENVHFVIDYGALDNSYNNNGPLQGNGNFYHNDPRSYTFVNGSLPIDSGGVAKWAFTWYPRIIDVDNEPWPHTEYAPNRLQMSIDTVFMGMGHLHLNPGTDTITVSIWDIDAMETISLDSGATGTLYGKVEIMTDTSLLGGNGSGGTPGAFQFSTFYPFVFPSTVVIPQGKRFLVQVTLNGPGGNAFILGSSRRSDCGMICGASEPYIKADFNEFIQGFNSTYALRVPTPQGPTIFFPSEVYNDCNTNGEKDSICEELTTQNLDIFPSINAFVPNFYVDAAAMPAAACPGSTVLLTADYAGSDKKPLELTWTSKQGSLSATGGKQVSLTMPTTLQNDTVIVTVTDEDDQTTMDTIIVRNNGIRISVSNNTQPLVIPCDGSITITTSSTGNTNGRNYLWSNGSKGALQSTLLAEEAGVYTVTVTNNSGCSASVSGEVVYANVANSANYSYSTPTRVNCPITFTNTSDKYSSPWTSTWKFATLDVFTITNGTQKVSYQFNSPGVFPVTLTLDSAGCTFSKTMSVTIVSGVCVGIEELTENVISLYPNPASTQLFVSINDFQPQRIAIYDVNGRKVSEQQYETQVDISTLTSGIYFIEVKNESKVARARFVKM